MLLSRKQGCRRFYAADRDVEQMFEGCGDHRVKLIFCSKGCLINESVKIIVDA